MKECCKFFAKFPFGYMPVKNDDGTSTKVLAFYENESDNIKLRVNYCPSCGAYVRDLTKIVKSDVLKNEILKDAWHDSDVEKPEKSGKYLCWGKFGSKDKYDYYFFEYDHTNDAWSVTDSCTHFYWADHVPPPVNK